RAYVDVLEVRAAVAVRELSGLLVDGQLVTMSLAARLDERLVDLSAERRRAALLLRLLDQRLIELAQQLAFRHDPDCDRRACDRHRDRRGDVEREPCAKAHGSSRNAYPTPRTVWSRRRSPPSSSLRRRYPMYTQSALEVAPKS